MSQIIPKVSATDLAAVADLADENIITEDELSLVGSGAQGGFEFDGNDYLDGPSDDFGTSDFTLVFDLLWDDAPGATEVLCRKATGNNRWTFEVNASQYRFQITNNAGTTNTYSWTITPSVNHRNIILSADRSGNATLYLNGASQGTRDISIDSPVNLGSENTNPLRIGYSSTSFDGKMFQVRYYLEAKTSAQVLNIAKGHNDTDNLFLKLAPTSTNESGWTDVSGNNRSFTANGATRIESNISKNYTSHSEYTAWQKKDGGYEFTDGADKLTTDLDLAGLPSASFVTTFIHQNAGSFDFLFSDYNSDPNRSFYIGIKSDNKIQIYFYDGTAANYNRYESKFSVNDGQQYTLAVVRNSVSDTVVYLDGEKIPMTTLTGGTGGSTNFVSTTARGITIGNSETNGNPFDGTIREARIFNYALSDDDVQEYSRGAATKFVDRIDTNINWLRENEDVAEVTAGATITTNSNRAINISNSGGGTKFVNLIGPNGSTTEWSLYKKYRFSGTVNSITGSIAFGGFEGPDIQINSTGDFLYEVVFDNDVNGLLFLAVSDGESISISNMVVELVGETASYLPTSATESIWEDCSNLNNHATNNGATLLTPSLQETYTTNQQLVSSRVGDAAAYRFDGNLGDQIAIASGLEFAKSTYVISAKLESLDLAPQRLFSSNYTAGIALTIDSYNGVRFWHDSTAVSFGFVPEVGQWYVFAVTVDGTNEKLYVNGKLVSTQSVGLVPESGAGNIMHVGRDLVGGSSVLHGLTDRFQIYNRALTSSEVEQVSRGQRLGFADVGPDGTATYSSDFSAGVDGWSASGGSGSAPETVDGRTNTYKFTTNTISGTKYISGKTLVVGKRYRAKYSFYVDASNDVIDGIAIRDGVSTLKSHKSVTAGQWHDETFEFIATGTNFNIAFQDGASGTINDAGGDDFVALKAIEITALGEVLALLPSSAATGKWYNEGGAGSSGDGTVTGATLINERKRGVFDDLYLDNVPSSDAGLSTGEVYRDNNGHLKIVI